jgi:sec-independent protein translocase protein TatC
MLEDTFISHLVELRDRLLRAIIAIAIVFIVLFPWASELYDILAAPMLRALPEGSKMIATGVVTPFLIPVKVAMMVAFMVALPYVLYQAWAFVAPGLYVHEKRMIVPLVFASTLLFLAGMAFCYFFVFRTVFTFIYGIAPKSISVAPDIENYLNFVLTMFLSFGVAFEVPIVVVVLVRMGVLTIEQLKEARPYFIVGAFVIAAIVTPPDVVSQLMLAFPMWFLYEAGIIAARLFRVRTRTGEDDYQPPAESEMERELDAIEAQEKGAPKS